MIEMIDGYPKYMRESIKKVEETRQDRVDKLPKPMSMSERKKILNKFHPDFDPKGKRKVRTGPNKGDIVPNEVADLLEAYPSIAPKDIDLSNIDYDVDVLVIGGGMAGTVAALWALKEGIKKDKILITTKLRHGDSNSIKAQGGIQCADREEDSPAMHYLDVIGGGHFANKPELARALVTDAPKILDWHEDLGVMYDRDNGKYLELSGGGTSRFRLHSAKDYTGLEIMRVLRDESINQGIEVIEFASAIELLLDDGGKVAGALLYNMETEEYSIAKAKSTILATGGFGRLHIQSYPTTNHYGATADGLVMAYRAGANFVDMDTVQYHPTGAAYPEQIVGQLITEKVRGLGGQPVNKDGKQFVFPLEPRDVEAAAIIRECTERNKGVKSPTGMVGIWLDTPIIEIIHGKGAVKENLHAIYRMYERFDIDVTKDPILVFPTLHYQNGGVEIDVNAATSVAGLFAAGEVEGGVHGKNRLMGNSLLDCNVFGLRAGISAAKHAKKTKLGKLTLQHVEKYTKNLEKNKIKPKMRSPMLLPEYREEDVLARRLRLST
jgi:succinate dehydrogenase / fumarate reductase flavoprotein subunit